MKKKNRKPFEQIQRHAVTAPMPNGHIRIGGALIARIFPETCAWYF
jgi:hypothetical protein